MFVLQIESLKRKEKINKEPLYSTHRIKMKTFKKIVSHLCFIHKTKKNRERKNRFLTEIKENNFAPIPNVENINT